MPRTGPPAPHEPTAMRPSDAFFWHAEHASPELRPLVAGLFILDRCPERHRLRRALQRLVVLAPRLAHRVVAPSLGIGLPSWVADGAFDLDYHLRFVALPRGPRAAPLLGYAGDVFSAPLDDLRPLWEAHLIEGLADGRAALFLKMHHSVLDGAGSLALFDGLTQARRQDAIRIPRAGGARLGVTPQPAAGALLAQLADPAAMVEVLRGLVRGASGLAGELGRSVETPPWHAGGSGIGRRLAMADVDLRRLRRIKDAFGATLNDVVLTAVAGALRRYEGVGGRGPLELQCMVPMSLRGSDEGAALGNRVGGFTVALPIGERTATARLARIRSQTQRAKSDGHGAGFKVMMQAAAYLPPALFRAAAQRTHGKLHLLCSNVPGPTVARYLAGARIDAVHPFAPVMRGTPLSIALISYAGRIGFGIDADPAEIPDPQRIATLLVREFDALERHAPRRGRRAR